MGGRRLPKGSSKNSESQSTRKNIHSVKIKREGNHELHFPFHDIQDLFNQGPLKYKVPAETGVFIAAIEEYLAAEVLELSGNRAKTNGSTELSKEDIVTVIKEDKELERILGDCLP